MAIKALTPGRVYDYVLKADVRPTPKQPTADNPDPDNSDVENWKPTVWKIKALDSGLVGILKDNSTSITVDQSDPTGDVSTKVGINRMNFELCQFGLAAPVNFIDESGLPIPYTTGKLNRGGKSYEIATSDFVGRIPEEYVTELADRIMHVNELSADEGNG